MIPMQDWIALDKLNLAVTVTIKSFLYAVRGSDTKLSIVTMTLWVPAKTSFVTCSRSAALRARP